MRGGESAVLIKFKEDRIQHGMMGIPYVCVSKYVSLCLYLFACVLCFFFFFFFISFVALLLVCSCCVS